MNLRMIPTNITAAASHNQYAQIPAYGTRLSAIVLATLTGCGRIWSSSLLLTSLSNIVLDNGITIH